MFGKFKPTSGLLVVLATVCALQLLTIRLGFWSLTLSHRYVTVLANVALAQINAIDVTTQHPMEARINLSRAATRMFRDGPEPADIVCNTRENS